jgi:glycosyltransferase involved in cell wall biosynthesis
MDQPLISVIIPVYNMELYLARCLDSVLDNTYRNLEIICIDDGSKDRSLEILREYETRDSRIKVIAKENGGVSSARNAGLDRMTGDFVTFIDPDDFVHPQYFELFLCAQAETHSDFVIGQFQKVAADSIPTEYEPLKLENKDFEAVNCEKLFRSVEYRRYCTIRMINSRMIGSLRFRENMTYGEDTTFIAELWEQNPQMIACAVSMPTYFYFEREESASQTAKEERKLCMIELFVSKIPVSKQNEVIYLDYVIRSSLSNRDLARYIHPDRRSAKAYSSLLRSQVGKLTKSAVYSSKEKIAILAFIFFPGLHWAYRTKKDPSLRSWQRAEQQKRREEQRKQ